MKILAALITFIILGILLFLLCIYSGVYNFAATEPHSVFAKWIFSTSKERSIIYHAKDITVPPLNNESMINTGFHHYKEMCVGCHGAPGVSPSEMSEGLNPEPPKLAEWKEELKQEELQEAFWVIKNGIKMTGMPAFKATHSDEEIWGIVAFLNQLPNLSPEEYKAMAEKTEDTGTVHNHGNTNGHNHEHSHEH